MPGPRMTEPHPESRALKFRCHPDRGASGFAPTRNLCGWVLAFRRPLLVSPWIFELASPNGLQS
jgi:hypothetical protein